MQVERIASFEDLQELAGPWNCLTRGVPFRSWQWLFSRWNHYRADNELYVLAVRDPRGEVVGIAPWYLSRDAARGRVVQFLGSGEVCSDYLGLLLSVEHHDAVVIAVANWLLAAVHSTDDRWDRLDLDGIDNSDRTVSKLVGQLQEDGCRIRHRTTANCWRIELPDSWDSYLSQLSKSHRKQLRRVERRCLDTGYAVVHTASNYDELARAMEILVDLHMRRRQSLGQPGCFASTSFSGFLHEAAESLFDAGMLRLHWVELDDRPVAAEFHVVGGEVVYAYQAGVDPAALEEEPGRLINIATIQQAIEMGCSGFDFLRGDEAYKAHWRGQPRPIDEWRVAATRTSSRIRHAALAAGDTMRDLIKGGLNITGIR